jgi:ribosomal protein L37AE/L43A
VNRCEEKEIDQRICPFCKKENMVMISYEEVKVWSCPVCSKTIQYFISEFGEEEFIKIMVGDPR